VVLLVVFVFCLMFLFLLFTYDYMRFMLFYAIVHKLLMTVLLLLLYLVISVYNDFDDNVVILLLFRLKLFLVPRYHLSTSKCCKMLLCSCPLLHTCLLKLDLGYINDSVTRLSPFWKQY
jgi:hypothetical protein